MIFIYGGGGLVRVYTALVFGLPVLYLLLAFRLEWDGIVSETFIFASLISVIMLVLGFYKKIWFYVALSVAAVCGIYVFVPTLIMDLQAKTPEDHLNVAKAYTTRGEIFPDQKTAWKQFLIAAQGGNAEAQFNVGAGYLYGWYGIDRDREQARHWMKAAADQGYDKAQKDLPDVDKASF